MDTRKIMKRSRFEPARTDRNESGQSIVLIALALVALIAFIGIAVDVGFIFVRGSQLQAAIDSAALAGVTELSGWTESGAGNNIYEAAARTKSAQFLNANGMPLTVTNSLNSNPNLYVRQTPLGATEYSITATWPVETFFLKVIGFVNDINLTRSATAGIFTKADIYASRRIEDGIISTSNQAVFGPDICTAFGDPFSPWNSPYTSDHPYTYEYRIMIPQDYPFDEVRVEIFDPDSINAPNQGSYTIAHTNAAILQGMSPTMTANSCPNGNNQKNPCLIQTQELELYNDGILPLDRINPFFFWRIDENRGTGQPGNGCGEPGSYDATRNTQTLYSLSYFKQNNDGTNEEVLLATYTGQTGDGSRDNGAHMTDLHWVSPGAPSSFDELATVPVDPGSPKTFQISLSTDTPDIVVDQSNGNRYINLGVSAISGASENGYEVWAGPPDYINSVPSEANARNLHVLNTPGSHSSYGVTVFASGNLPMNSNFTNAVEIPLIYVGPEMAGQDIRISLFDTDSGAQPPITFFFDSIAEADWSMTFALDTSPPYDNPLDPDGRVRNCIPGGCNNMWVDPPYQITVPGLTEQCDHSDPTDLDCVPFYGGRLTARYIGGSADTYGWQITTDGLPYLVR